MFKKVLLSVFGLLICSVFVSSTPGFASDAWKLYEYADFIASEGDYLVADLDDGIGYLVNDENKALTVFPLLSGQQRNVCYIGRCYFAATPQQDWVVKDENIQGDRITFSKSGEFLRLYENGEKRTSYGIHGHAYFDAMIEKDTYFQSMGCLIVADDVLDVIQESFAANTDGLSVYTMDDVEISGYLKFGM